jgi:hypothetical protein
MNGKAMASRIITGMNIDWREVKLLSTNATDRNSSMVMKITGKRKSA